MEETQTAIDLISGGIAQITRAKSELQALINQYRDDYVASNSKDEKKMLLSNLKEIEKETHFNDVMGKANEMTFILEARMTEAESNKNRLSRKLSVKKQQNPVMMERETNIMMSKESNQGNNDNSRYFSSNQGSEWLSEDSSNGTADHSNDSQSSCKSIKTPVLTLPKFFGVDEDFPEFWAIYETLVHNNKNLSTVEKMMCLKESLKGKSDIAIKGTQLIPQNYNWMIDTLQKKYGNKPTNRARIVQRLSFLRPANNSAESCTYVFDKISMLTNQMVSAGQDIRKSKDAMWTENILQKFPHEIVKNVLIAIKDRDELQIEDLMRQIESEISAKTYVESRMKSHHVRTTSQLHGYSQFTRNAAQPHCGNRSYQEVAPKPLPKAMQGCAYCENSGHYSAHCPTITEIADRRKVLLEKGLCWKCFSSSHTSTQCEKTDCPLCNRKHHLSVCFASNKTNYKDSTANRGIITHDQRSNQGYAEWSTENILRSKLLKTTTARENKLSLEVSSE
ncbi:hypothetical protein Y032_0178g647 [Ancylostoma ceylanicum]|uniref:CCHC-type domain-containing protein n=1 Tax=Ancylostoma ceylanicum TaxID=53326 RepID=A0A016STV1_9BILA|nr:hypothetical protein Y032_0178g647 [Ancylostoma ceylanicum]